jgi:hypothetical protein
LSFEEAGGNKTQKTEQKPKVMKLKGGTTRKVEGEGKRGKGKEETG